MIGIRKHDSERAISNIFKDFKRTCQNDYTDKEYQQRNGIWGAGTEGTFKE